ncbi:MAG TPA: DNA gyrase subunit A [Candidatus Woesebacteria bacterium]|nr:DNA gyrase subunit A [Candidatus Woesebacteria bacterium]
MSEETKPSNTEETKTNISNDDPSAKFGTTEESKYGTLKHTDIVDEMEKSYLDYAMSVIVSRALPDVRDGLKPVHRRILYSMYKSGIHHNGPYKKSARIVGDVLGKYHPHGDSAVYMALVRLAQDFNMRYPLVDGQGNFGSIDGDSPAAMRYTEARSAKITQELLADINKDTVDFVDNFDGSLKEPLVLPTRLPNFLLMGSEGIAVGMATKIPPHNLTESCNAVAGMVKKGKAISDIQINVDEKNLNSNSECINTLLDSDPRQLAGHFESEITHDELMTFIKGPDFPTAGIIYNQKAISEAYRTGKGRIIVRGKASIEENKRGQMEIVITELPYQVNKARLLMKIADLIRDKKISGIKNLRDDSDRAGMQITVELKKDARPKVILNKLFKMTELQSSFSLNMVALNSDGTPQLMTLSQVLKEYVIHRQLVITRRSQAELKEARDRAHILEGLLIALANLDEVIATIRNSSDSEAAHQTLMKKFGLSDPQATAILEMQLKRLAALERQKIEDEYKAIQETIVNLIHLLSDPNKILAVLLKENQEMIDLYGDERLTKVVKSRVGEFNEEDLIADENTVITLTESGYIKRLSPDAFRSQSRGGKGAKGLNMKAEDVLMSIVTCTTHDQLFLFTNQGRVFNMKAFEIPEASRIAKGTAIVNLLNLKADEKVLSIVIVDEERDRDKYITLATKKGLVKKTAVKLYDNIRQSGIVAITLNEGDELVWGKVTTGKDNIMLITHDGKSIRFSETEVKSSQRDTKGVKGITLKPGDYVIGVEVFRDDPNVFKENSLMIITENGMGKRTLLEHYPLQKRSGLGVKVSEITKRTGKVAAAKLISDRHDEIVISTKSGKAIKMPISKKSIPTLTRPTQGVILMKLEDHDQIAAVALTVEENDKT